jgi:dCMP deaminase
MEKYFELAKSMAKASTCFYQKGAVIIKKGLVVSTGRNSTPKGIKSCITKGFCLKREMGFASGEGHHVCPSIHAETFAMLKAQLAKVSIKGAQIYCTHKPCFSCAKMLIHFGISEVYYLEDYPGEMADKILQEARVVVVKVDENNFIKYKVYKAIKKVYFLLQMV